MNMHGGGHKKQKSKFSEQMINFDDEAEDEKDNGNQIIKEEQI